MLSLRSRVYRYFLSRSKIFSLEIEPMRRQLMAVGGRARVQSGVSVIKTSLGGVPALQFDPATANGDIDLLYLHGGGGCLGLMPMTVTFASRLAHASRMRVTVPEYRVAPEHPYPAAMNDVVAVYGALTESPHRRLVLAGDSFGFGLGLAGLLASPQDRRPRFEAALGFTPLVDLTGGSETLISRRRRDPLRVANPLWLPQIYANGADVSSPLLSPLFGPMEGLPPLILQAAEDDVLLGDSLHLAERARHAGVPVTLRVFSGMWHVFQLSAGTLRESNCALDEAVKALRAQAATPAPVAS